MPGLLIVRSFAEDGTATSSSYSGEEGSPAVELCIVFVGRRSIGCIFLGLRANPEVCISVCMYLYTVARLLNFPLRSVCILLVC
mmetsp:Transcript_115090/g.372285  ORF Transcript_115090/g.372285 Transcript_115090/m.372285 type:complete len:84 (+) Transcript_115090:15-266(+)